MQNGQEIEYELTFLAKSLPKELSDIEPKRLVDIYIPESMEVHPQLRLRQKGNKYEITKKQPIAGNDSSAQLETTIVLEENEFQTLANKSKRSVAKNRYEIDIDGRPAEIDVFVGELEGLVLIDFEFSSEAEKNEFKAPGICLADVTQEKFIAGGLLAGRSYSEISTELEKYGYTPITV
jgi:CYTH domain-containing protein